MIVYLRDTGSKELSLSYGFNESANKASRKLQEARIRLQEAQAKWTPYSEVIQVLQRLVVSWLDEDPGKYGAHYSFLNQKAEPVIVRELLDEGTEVFQGSWPDWSQRNLYPKKPSRREILPPGTEVISLSEVLTAECPECGKESPLIRHYEQTYDSPFGDTWEKSFLVLCCDKVQRLNHYTSDYRF